MNTISKHVLMALTSASVLAACGKYEKSPVENISTMRDQARKEKAQGQPGERVRVVEKIVKVPEVVIKEVPRIEYKTVEVPVEQLTPTSNLLVIRPDSSIRFVEGKELSFKVKVQVLRPGAKAKLASPNLPEGLTMKADADDSETYVLTWKPAPGTIPMSDAYRIFPVSMVATVASAANQNEMNKLRALERTETVDLVVYRNQAPPTELKVNELPDVIDAETATPFNVTVKVPGVLPAPGVEPRLDVTYDGVGLSPGNDYQERNGAVFVIADSSRKQVEYLGNETWRFNRVYDTRGGTVLPQIARNGSPAPNAEFTNVRLSFKVISPYGSSTADTLKKMKIRRARGAAATTVDENAPPAPAPNAPAAPNGGQQ